MTQAARQSAPSSARSKRERQKAETRAELIDAARKLVQESGYEGLTIRNLAKRAGYAPMSVYSYFADKHDILMALAEDTFETLARKLRKNQPEDPVEALRATLRDYATFGLENPNEYRTIFMTEKLHPDCDEPEMIDRLEKNNPALIILNERVAACIAAGRFKGDVQAIATVLWTVGHGAISLLINFPHYPFGNPQDYIMRIGEIALAGIATMDVLPLEDASSPKG
ncbi:TetR/AcrR family transcriptional regulator [Oryzicola mucosus]|uniref:TetR/AcrR family transcriptional regulator n=1 Tax=Oryzicola mucosus TaxID=2767425 RepID=A0A8J6Q158_9HYPH|nr:TetR/AcrR family transcriptional regulator [Oryzicola mucosus]MBD0414380.1 TetR/AcrR family transcriptional regulator [Oryzicola mucosus]